MLQLLALVCVQRVPQNIPNQQLPYACDLALVLFYAYVLQSAFFELFYVEWVRLSRLHL